MPEFKKKTALGLRDLPENGQECTHVLLTHSEYDGLLAKVACAERDARSVYTAASQKIAQAERNEEKILEHQIKTLTRKERTHRLCTRAAMLESYLPHPEAITDEQVSLFLKLLFRQDSTRQLMEKVFAGNGTEKEGAE